MKNSLIRDNISEHDTVKIDVCRLTCKIYNSLDTFFGLDLSDQDFCNQYIQYGT